MSASRLAVAVVLPACNALYAVNTSPTLRQLTESGGDSFAGSTRDVQVMFVGGIAGVLLTLALRGERRIPGHARNAVVQTEPTPPPPLSFAELPPLMLPPMPLRFVPSLPPPQLTSETAYLLPPQVPQSDCAIQTDLHVSDALVQTDWYLSAVVVHRGAQTEPPPPSFSAGVQTLGIPSVPAFTQATPGTCEASTQSLPSPVLTGHSARAVTGAAAAFLPALQNPPETVDSCVLFEEGGGDNLCMPTLSLTAGTAMAAISASTSISPTTTTNESVATITQNSLSPRQRGCHVGTGMQTDSLYHSIGTTQTQYAVMHSAMTQVCCKCSSLQHVLLMMHTCRIQCQ